MTTPDYRALCAELADRLDYVTQCLLDDNRLTDPLSDHARALLAAPEARPPAAVSPTQLRPVDRYTLSDAILVAWHKHGNDSWCSIADEVIAALAAPEAVGVADEEITEILDIALEWWNSKNGAEHTHALNELRAVLSRYGTAHPAPVPVGERLPELRLAIEKVLNDARCGRRTVGNIELADRLLDAVMHWALPLPGVEPISPGPQDPPR